MVGILYLCHGKGFEWSLKKEYSCEKAKGLDGGREASFVKINMKGIEYKCSMMNNEDRFIIKKNEKDNSDASFDTWNEWKEKSLKILKREE